MASEAFGCGGSWSFILVGMPMVDSPFWAHHAPHSIQLSGPGTFLDLTTKSAFCNPESLETLKLCISENFSEISKFR